MARLTKDSALDRIQYLEALITDSFPESGAYFPLKFSESMQGIHSLLVLLYGNSSKHVDTYTELRDVFNKGLDRNAAYRVHYPLAGLLRAVRFEIENGLTTRIESQSQGEILGEFLSLSKELLDDGYKESAAVLACGALEECIKKYVILNNLQPKDHGLTENINLLKAKGLLKGSQSGVIQSYVKIRNKAFHADFNKIEAPEIYSLLSFLEQFIVENFQ